MIFDMAKDGYEEGYQPRGGTGYFHAFFPTANVAFRRQALVEVGGFDTRCATGEDIDVSIRVANAGYELYFEPSARVTHYHRETIKGLLAQFFGYGRWHAYLFKKHSPRRRLQFYRYSSRKTGESPFGIRCVASIPFPLYGMVFLSVLQAIYAALVLIAVGLLAGSLPLAAAGLLLGAAAGYSYAARRFDVRAPVKSLRLAGIKLLVDSATALGGFVGGLRERVLYIEATAR